MTKRLHLHLYRTYTEARDAFALQADMAHLMGDAQVRPAEMTVLDDSGVAHLFRALGDWHDGVRLLGHRPERLTISSRVDRELATRVAVQCRAPEVEWV